MLQENDITGGGAEITFDRVSRHYPNATRPAVDDVSLVVKPGEFVVLLGPSGCGKTTLLRMVNRLIEPTSGRITIDGRSVGEGSAPDLRRSIGYVIQQTGLFPHMRIEDNVAVVPKLLGWSRASIGQRIDVLLDLVGLDPSEYRRRFPSQLSGGQQQRVGLARALAAEPSILLMDEPFGALDAITRLRLQDELKRIHQRLRQTVLFVTHDIDEAIRLADRIAVMREGRIEQFAPPLDLVKHPATQFVSDLIGAEDVMRRLGLISIADIALEPVENSGLPLIAVHADLRTALGLMMEKGSTGLSVVNDAGDAIGVLTIGAIRDASAPGSPP